MRGILLLILACSFINQVCATHFMGGDLSVCQSGPNSFDVTLTVYRDCNPGNSAFVSPTGIVVRDNVTNTPIMTFSMSNPTRDTLELGDDCYTPVGICVEEYVFTSTISLPNNPNGYYITWDECCRNSLVVNLQTPGAAGMTYYVQIPDPALVGGNCSPVFDSFPSDGYFCINSNNVRNFNVIDPDGDDLVYSFITPFDDNQSGPKPFSTCSWVFGTNLNNILGNTANPPMTIDSQTGDITCNPEVAGVFVFAVLVEEYRNGVKIGETVRDIQYNSINCTTQQPVFNVPDTVTTPVFTGVTEVNDGCFDLYLNDLNANGLDTFYLNMSSTFDFESAYVAPEFLNGQWYYDNFNQTNDTLWMPLNDSLDGMLIGLGAVAARFCWQPSCDYLDSIFELDVIAYLNGCSGLDSSIQTIIMNVGNDLPELDIEFPSINAGSPVSVSFDEPFCFDVMVQDTSGSGLPINLEPLTANFDYLGSYVPPQNINGQFYYSNFDGGDTLWINDYNYNSGTGNVVAVGDAGIRYCWNFECEDLAIRSFDIEYLCSISSCDSTYTSTNSFHLDIELPEDDILMPMANVFTPNNDGDNDFYYVRAINQSNPEALANDPCYDFMTVAIYNRWGRKVFESEDPEFKWDGKNQRGAECAEGTYFVLINGQVGSTYHPISAERSSNVVKQEYYIQLLR